MPEVSQSQPVEAYDVFISYSMDPDYSLSRRIENFLESFHKLDLPNNIQLKPQVVFRDNSDFSLHNTRKDAGVKLSISCRIWLSAKVFTLRLEQTSFSLFVFKKKSLYFIGKLIDIPYEHKAFLADG